MAVTSISVSESLKLSSEIVICKDLPARPRKSSNPAYTRRALSQVQLPVYGISCRYSSDPSCGEKQVRGPHKEGL